MLIWLITFCVDLTHLHHSIVGSAEVLAGLFGGSGITLGDHGHFCCGRQSATRPAA